MNKWVFGCLGLFIVVAIAGGFGAYHYLYKPARDYVASFTQLKVVPELNAQVANKAAFVPPADRELTRDSIARLLHVQQAIQTHMGERIKELEIKHQKVSGANGAQGEPSFAEAVSALKDLTALFLDAKRAQIEALNAQGFSLTEYEWTRSRVYEALGLPIDATLQQIIRDVSAGRAPDMEAIKTPPAPVPVPEKNRELVKPFAEELTEGAALAFFAL